MPTQKQFLDNTGLTQLLDELGQYLKGKQDKTNHLVINEDPTGGSQTIQNAEILNKIESITATESTASGGTNTVTITETNGTSTSFNVLNGINGGSLGDVDIVDVTGDRTDAVMSQKGVTDKVIRANSNDTAGLSESMMTKLTALGWEFGKKLNTSASKVNDENYCITNFIPIAAIQSHSLTIKFCTESDAYASTCFFNSSKSFVSNHYILHNAYQQKTLTYSQSNDAYVRMSCSVNNIENCYIKDNTTGNYLFKADDLLYDLYKDNVINYDYLSTYGITTEDLQGRSRRVQNLLQNDGWHLKFKVTYQDLSKDENKCVTPFIPYNFEQGHSITFHYGNEAGTGQGMVILYNEDNSSRANQYENKDFEITIAVQNNIYDKFRFTIDINKIAESYVYNNTKEEYIWRGDEYLANLIKQHECNLTYKSLLDNVITNEFGNSSIKVIDQNTVTKELNTAIYKPTPTYLQGRLAYFKLEDYPQLDPRTADGISVVYVCSNSTAENHALFNIFNPTTGINQGMSTIKFGLWRTVDKKTTFGKLSSYSGVGTGGFSFNASNIHIVATYDFKTGTVKFYRNGILAQTNIVDNYDKATIIDSDFNNFTHIQLCAPFKTKSIKTNGIAVFGSVLEADDVAKLYGNGNFSIRDSILPDTMKAINMHPIYPENWSVVVQGGAGTITSEEGGGYSIAARTSDGYIYFAFTNITNAINNCIYEWSFEVTSGSSTHNTSASWSRRMRYNSQYYECFTIYDENNNDVTFAPLSQGNTYHVVCRPDNTLVGSVNYKDLQLVYGFMGTTDFKIKIHPTLKITERGAALECSIKNYRGTYWELPSGIKLPLNNSTLYGTEDFHLGTDSYIEDTVLYTANVPPQFNGQTAIDVTNGKIYMGYLTGTGGTWKQINNS